MTMSSFELYIETCLFTFNFYFDFDALGVLNLIFGCSNDLNIILFLDALASLAFKLSVSQ